MPEARPLTRDAFRHVLCAVDFSQDSARALGYGVSLARRAGGHLTLVHVVEPMPLGYDPMGGVTFDTAAYEKAVAESARRQLGQFVPEDLAQTSGVDTVVTQGKAYREILRLAAERDVDLIVLGVHGRNAMDRLVFGSTTEHVVRRGTCPVLTVPAPWSTERRRTMCAALLLLPPARDRRRHPAREALVERLTGEFHEMPCLRLTLAQAQRLFGLRADVCQRVLSSLVGDGTRPGTRISVTG